TLACGRGDSICLRRKYTSPSKIFPGRKKKTCTHPEQAPRKIQIATFPRGNTCRGSVLYRVSITTGLWERCANSSKPHPLFLPSVLSHKSQTRDPSTILSTLQLRASQTTGIRIVSDAQQETHSVYGHYDYQVSTRSIPAVLHGSHPGMTVPSETNHFLSQALNELSDGLYGYAMVLSRDRTEAEDLVQET